jgi:hypothetical protein
MKVVIETSEFYPYYSLDENIKVGVRQHIISLPEDLVKRYLKIQKEFEEVTKEISELW